MKITIEPTEQFFMIGEVMVRSWQGVSDTGEPVYAFVSCVTFSRDVGDVPGLVSIPPPDPQAAWRWAEEVMRRAG